MLNSSRFVVRDINLVYKIGAFAQESEYKFNLVLNVITCAPTYS